MQPAQILSVALGAKIGRTELGTLLGRFDLRRNAGRNADDERKNENERKKLVHEEPLGVPRILRGVVFFGKPDTIFLTAGIYSSERIS